MITAEVDYPLLNLFWTTFLIFAWVLWIWLLIRVYGDIFGRHDIGGGAKTGWVVLTLFLPLVGCLIYLITQGRSMTDRAEREAEQQRASFEEYVKSVAAESAGDPNAKARALLADGAITEQEYARMTTTTTTTASS